MVPYTLADDSLKQTDDPIALSMRMMDVYKMDLLVLYLSFIGWYILSIFTLGILAILYVNPYLEQSKAIFYTQVKEAYKAS